MEVLGGTRVHESTVFQTVIFELLLVTFGDAESFQNFVVFQFQTCLRCTILNKTEHLKEKIRTFDEATIPANIFIVDLWFTHVTFVLDFDEIDLNNETTDLDDVSNDVVRGYGFDELDSIVGSEIVDLFFYSSDQFEVRPKQLKLDIDIKVIGNLSECIPNQNNMILQDMLF